jgi:hypothetical protein
MSRHTRIDTLSGSAVVGLLYLGCVVWDILLPAYAMQRVWAPLFPGFRWLSAGTFLLGLAESLVYGALLGWLVAEARRAVTRLVG